MIGEKGEEIVGDFVKSFHHHYFDSEVWLDTYWFGHRVLKCPLDLFNYQEILFQVKPDVIVECGTNQGGSALFLANMCDLLGKGKVITVDIQEMERPEHGRISYLLGDTTSTEIVNKIKESILPSDVVLVILDSDHTEPHVLQEMRLYYGLVSVGSYLIVEDTIIGGNPIAPHLAPGPMGAVQQFLTENDQFIVDESRHKFHLTFNPNGYLLKVK